MSRSSYIAAPSDGKDILRILESSAAKGQIELLYTRRPDAYASYMKEPGEARVFVSKANGRTVGTCAELIREVYIGGERVRAAYICGLKKEAGYPGHIGFGPGFLRGLQQGDFGYCFCSVLSDNTEAKRLFEAGSRLVRMRPVVGYRTYIVSTRVRVKTPAHTMTFRRATPEDAAPLLDFLHREGKKKDLFPVIDDFAQFPDLSVRDFFVLCKDGRIVAAAAAWNQAAYRQYVVKKYRLPLRLCRALNPLLSALGYIRLPRENEPLRFPMLSFFVCEHDREEESRILLGEAVREMARSYGMFVIGLPKGHPAAPLLDGLPSLHFDTTLYEISFPGGQNDMRRADARRLFPECGLL